MRKRLRASRRVDPSQRFGWVEAGNGDSALPDELRNCVRTWRELYRADEEEPTDASTRNALAKLAAIADEDASDTLRALDPRTEALLENAAWKVYRRKYPQPATIPPARLDLSYWSAADIRTFAAQALKNLPRSRGGRPRVRHEEFIRVLIGRWTWSGRKNLSEEELPLADAILEFGTLSRFIRAMFEHVGIRLSPEQLRAIRIKVLKTM